MMQMLDTQYRMHPIIREYPSLNFYGGSLKDGPNVLADTERPWHSLPAFKPLVFYDVPSKVHTFQLWGGFVGHASMATRFKCPFLHMHAMQETTPANSSSLVNHAEAEMVLSVYRELVHRCPELTMKPSVAIISPYKAQVRPGAGMNTSSCSRALTEHVHYFAGGPAAAAFQERPW